MSISSVTLGYCWYCKLSTGYSGTKVYVTLNAVSVGRSELELCVESVKMEVAAGTGSEALTVHHKVSFCVEQH